MRAEPNRGARIFLPLRARQAVLTVHIIMSVGLLGDAAGFLAIAIRAAATNDRLVAVHAVDVLAMLSVVFGIPLSFGAILTGLTLGIGTKWGIFRYPWVTTKLLLIVSVMMVGGLIIGPAQKAMLDGVADTSGRLIAAASYDVIALAVATTLSVFKPGRPFRRTKRIALAGGDGLAS
jgi:hypothetical protein